MLKKYSAILLLLNSAFLASCSTGTSSITRLIVSSSDIYTSESVTTRIEPSPDKKHFILHCIQSSTGSCYFYIGEPEKHTANTFALVSGARMEIDSVTKTEPFCVTGSKNDNTSSCKDTFINTDGSIKTVTITYKN